MEPRGLSYTHTRAHPNYGRTAAAATTRVQRRDITREREQTKMTGETRGRAGEPEQRGEQRGRRLRKTARSLKTTTRHSGPRKKDGMSLNDGPRDRLGK